MARAAAKKKRDVPPLYVITERITRENGSKAVALVPAFQHDDERLQSFRLGTRLVATIGPDGSRRGVRKWHAIIGKAVKASLLPWVTVSAADEAIRLALEMYEPKRANDGSWHKVTQSLNDLTDEELDEQIELMSALIYRISGVDPDEFRKELAGAGDERFKSDYDQPAADNQNAGSATSIASPLDVATIDLPEDRSSQASGGPAGDDPLVASADSSGAEQPSPAPATGTAAPIPGHSEPRGEASASDGSQVAASAETRPAATPEANTPQSSGEDEAAGVMQGLAGPGEAPAAELSKEDRAWLVTGAQMMMATQPEPCAEAKTVLFNQVKAILGLMPKNASAEARTRLEQIKQHCLAVCRGEVDLNAKLIAALAAVSSVADITPAPIKTRSA